MVRKKVEGDEDQRRAAAHEAARAGRSPSARGTTTGASKQPRHLPDSDSLTHDDRVGTPHRGKQRAQPDERWLDERETATWQQDRRFADDPSYRPRHERVFQALTEAERAHGGEGVHLDDVARAARLPRDETRALLHDLTVEHRLVTEVQGADSPDLGPRYEAKPRF